MISLPCSELVAISIYTTTLTDKPDFRFQKHHRIRLQADFDRVFKTGEVVSDATLVIHACRNELGYSRLGLSISKRVGSAPVRNQWKRWIREAFRLNRSALPTNVDFVVRPRREAQGSFQAIQSSLKKLLPKAEKRLEKLNEKED